MVPMMRSSLIGFLLFLFAGPAFAEFSAQRVHMKLAAQGFESINFFESSLHVTVEALRGGLRVVFVYDAKSGALIDERVSQISALNSHSRGNRISPRSGTITLFDIPRHDSSQPVDHGETGGSGQKTSGLQLLGGEESVKGQAVAAVPETSVDNASAADHQTNPPEAGPK